MMLCVVGNLYKSHQGHYICSLQRRVYCEYVWIISSLLMAAESQKFTNIETHNGRAVISRLHFGNCEERPKTSKSKTTGSTIITTRYAEMIMTCVTCFCCRIEIVLQKVVFWVVVLSEAQSDRAHAQIRLQSRSTFLSLHCDSGRTSTFFGITIKSNRVDTHFRVDARDARVVRCALLFGLFERSEGERVEHVVSCSTDEIHTTMTRLLLGTTHPLTSWVS